MPDATLDRPSDPPRSHERGRHGKAVEAIAGAVGTELGGRTLELGRNLLPLIIAADPIEFPA